MAENEPTTATLADNTAHAEGDTLTPAPTTVTITYGGEKKSTATDAVQVDGKVYAKGVPIETTEAEAAELRKRTPGHHWTVKTNTPVAVAQDPAAPDDPLPTREGPGEPVASADGGGGTVEVIGGRPTVTRDTTPNTSTPRPRR